MYILYSADDLDSVFALIGHHYCQAQDYDNAFKSYERAARNASYLGLKEKCLDFLLKALQLVPACTFTDYENFSDLKLINWYIDAYHLLREFGRFEEANNIYAGRIHTLTLSLSLSPYIIYVCTYICMLLYPAALLLAKGNENLLLERRLRKSQLSHQGSLLSVMSDNVTNNAIHTPSREASALHMDIRASHCCVIC